MVHSCIFGFRVGFYHTTVVLSFLRYAVSALFTLLVCLFLADKTELFESRLTLNQDYKLTEVFNSLMKDYFKGSF